MNEMFAMLFVVVAIMMQMALGIKFGPSVRSKDPHERAGGIFFIVIFTGITWGFGFVLWWLTMPNPVNQ